jgi:phytoene synthase
MSAAGLMRDPVWQAARLGDRDRYVSALLAAEPERAWMIALAGFNGDLRRIADTLSEPQLAQIRLQWWRETFDRLKTGEPAGAPIADALAAGLNDRSQAVQLLKGIVDARQFDVLGGAMADEAELTAYLRKSEGALFSLAADRQTTSARSIGDDVGLACGLSRIACGFSRDFARGRMFLPRDLLKRHGVDAERLLAGEFAPALVDVLTDLNSSAREALSRARSAIAANDRSVPRAFLPLALVEPDLKALERTDIAAKKTAIGLAPPWRIARIAWAGLLNRV